MSGHVVYMKIQTLDDVETEGKTVLMRADFNSPIDPTTRETTDSTRIRGHVETVNEFADAKLVVLAHQGRPGDSDFVTLEQQLVTPPLTAPNIQKGYIRSDKPS